MTVFIPHYDNNGRKGNNDKLQENFISDNKLLEDYPRIEKIFTVDKIYDIRNATEKKKLVEALFRNIKKR
ncbi:hypothetical protein [Herpetosiphon sp. NSE202]|uniref:hypothetical protein n=1 Tax=Herpetosiphon sp. NSE202 TaxID=3351349 RepID=UPI003629BF35